MNGDGIIFRIIARAGSGCIAAVDVDRVGSWQRCGHCGKAVAVIRGHCIARHVLKTGDIDRVLCAVAKAEVGYSEGFVAVRPCAAC